MHYSFFGIIYISAAEIAIKITVKSARITKLFMSVP